MFFNNNNIIFLDYPIQGQICFQDAATSIMYGIINLHHHIMSLLVFVLIFVFFIFNRTFVFSVYTDKNKIICGFDSIRNFIGAALNYSFFNYKDHFSSSFSNYINNVIKLKKWYNFDVSHGTFLEIVWTFIPSFILLLIVGPSFALLYTMDACINPDITVKIIGHQWYWSYEYTDAFNLVGNWAKAPFTFNGVSTKTVMPQAVLDISVDSYMLTLNDLTFGDLRLLEVDNPLYLPVHTKIRLDITAADVIHSFAVPSLGIKVDAIPGRINVAYIEIIRCGIYFGQCSELCGVNHGFMPIKIIVTDSDVFLFNVMLHFNTVYSWLHNATEFYTKSYLKNIF